MSNAGIPRPSDAYAEYLGLLHELHIAMRTHGGDSPEADAIRDRMDAPWLLLNPPEIADAQMVSEALYDSPPASTAYAAADTQSDSPAESCLDAAERTWFFL